MGRCRRMVMIPTVTAAMLAVTVSTMGCGDNRFGSELSARPKPRPMRAVADTPLRLPEAEEFSIALPSARKEPGLGGTAEADAQASGAGTAEAFASVTDSGTASGTFQLGHGFANDTDRQADFEFTVRFHHSFDAAATPASAYPDASVGLKLYARSLRGRLLRDLTLVQHSTDNGSVNRAGDETARFTLTLGPDEAVNVFLAGQVQVEIREGRSAHGTLKLSDVQMEVVTTPAPAVQSAGDEQ